MRSPMKSAAIALVVAAVAVAGGAFWWVRARPKAEAIRLCKAAVEKTLRSPGSARFAPDLAAEERYAGIYHLESWVDSQNAFGALVRTDFRCIVQDQGDGPVARVESAPRL